MGETHAAVREIRAAPTDLVDAGDTFRVQPGSIARRYAAVSLLGDRMAAAPGAEALFALARAYLANLPPRPPHPGSRHPRTPRSRLARVPRYAGDRLAGVPWTIQPLPPPDSATRPPGPLRLVHEKARVHTTPAGFPPRIALHGRLVFENAGQTSNEAALRAAGASRTLPSRRKDAPLRSPLVRWLRLRHDALWPREAERIPWAAAAESDTPPRNQSITTQRRMKTRQLDTIDEHDARRRFVRGTVFPCRTTHAMASHRVRRFPQSDCPLPPMSKRLAAAIRVPLLAVLAVALAGCGPDYRLDRNYWLCVELADFDAMDAEAEERAILQLDPVLRARGYVRYRRNISMAGRVIHEWWVAEPKRGNPYNHVDVNHYLDEPRRSDCRLRIAVHADFHQPHGEREWNAFFTLRDRVIPALFPTAPVRIVDHPALATWAWNVPALADRFAPDHPLPPEVRERIDAYESRSAVGRWMERASVELSTTWRRTAGRHLFGAAMYLLFPLNWIAFLAFAAAAWLGRRLVRSPRWRARGLVALAVLALTPVMVPTFVGAVYMPHGFVQVYDFDPRYYFREPVFATAAALATGLLAWWLLRLLRRSRAGRAGSEAR